MRANAAHYFKNKHDQVFAMTAADDAPETIDRGQRILASKRNISIASRPLGATSFEAGGNRMDYVFYESGLKINVMFGIEDGAKHAVGLKSSMDVPQQLAAMFRFARQEWKPTGVVRGTYFAIKGEYRERQRGAASDEPPRRRTTGRVYLKRR